MSGPTQPLIRLATGKPVLTALDAVYDRSDELLTRIGLARESFDDPEVFVHAIVMYQFFEEVAAAAENPFFLAGIGKMIARSKWPPLVEAADCAITLGSFLTKLVVVATDHSSSTEHHLDVSGKSGFVFGRRYYDTPFIPAQIDGFFAAMFGEIIKRSVGEKWNSDDVMVTISDPRALPIEFLGCTVLAGDRRGHQIAFPAVWLTEPFSADDFFKGPTEQSGKSPPPKRAIFSVREALKPHIGVQLVNNEVAASICGLSEQQLSRRLRKEGTSLGKLIAQLKCEHAERLLTEQNASVAEVADVLGYSDATSFAHAFRSWTGKAPSDLKKQMDE
ncbi:MULTISPECIES: helix-turn-helix domain-containing protein [Ruegeria]|uniref:helix-turn-helix domain-containing protein n=1 Tax=Ruegeria TaxID=97050 RepID=UPI00147DE755|nr:MULTISPECIES: AraC family transcriptional regulator [Ruegeria]